MFFIKIMCYILVGFANFAFDACHMEITLNASQFQRDAHMNEKIFFFYFFNKMWGEFIKDNASIYVVLSLVYFFYIAVQSIKN